MPRGISNNPEVTRAKMRARTPWNKGHRAYAGIICGTCHSTFNATRSRKFCSLKCWKASPKPQLGHGRPFGYIMSEDTRRKIGDGHRGMRHSPATKSYI